MSQITDAAEIVFADNLHRLLVREYFGILTKLRSTGSDIQKAATGI